MRVQVSALFSLTLLMSVLPNGQSCASLRQFAGLVPGCPFSVFAQPVRPAAHADGGALSLTIQFNMAEGDEGVLVIAGSQSEAFALYVSGGRLIFRYQHILDKSPSHRISSALRPGDVRVRYEFDPESMRNFKKRGNGRLWVNDTQVIGMPKTISKPAAYDRDTILQHTFTGTITGVTFENGVPESGNR
jgi:hypothetical protein